MYAVDAIPKESLEVVLPAILGVAAPHVEAMESLEDPWAALLVHRMRRALLRLDPLLDETMAQLLAIKENSATVVEAETRLCDTLGSARMLLRDTKKRPAVFPPTLANYLEKRRLNGPVRKALARLAQALDAHGTRSSRALSKDVERWVRALISARQGEVRANIVLHDVERLLRVGLVELASLGQACEQDFPDVATLVKPRDLIHESDAQEPTPSSRFDVQ